MALTHFYRGARFQLVTFTAASGRDEVRTYLDAMQRPDRAKMVALLHLAANEGPPFNRPDRCRRLSPDEFNEFKTHGHRILWVTRGDTIIMMTAFEKKQQKTPEAEKIRGRNALAAIEVELRDSNHGR